MKVPEWITLLIFCDFVLLHTVSSNDCCVGLPEDESSCRDICFKVSEATNQVDQISMLASAPSQCPHHLMEFWRCIEQAVPAILDMGAFSGRPCCNLTKTKACRESCVKAKSMDDIEQHCSQSTEDTRLFDCIERQKAGEKCCGKATSQDGLLCKATCWNMYLTNTIASSDAKRQLRHHCTGRNHEVDRCVHKQTRTTRQSSSLETIHCCDLSTDDACRTVCKAALQSDDNQDAKMNRMIETCGTVDLVDPLYTCFLKYDDGNNQAQDPAGIDTAKLHCCQKAKSERCGSLCVKTHGWKWGTIRKFEQHCVYQTSPVMETNMLSCLKDVEEPCQLGCSGLNFCTNLNNRPTEHFRSCNSDADEAARKDIQMWQEGQISLPNFDVPVKDIRTCEPEMWKAIACTYQIKPCFRKPVALEICREDCVYIINKCVDTSRLEDGQLVLDRCKRLALASSGECISVGKYTVEGSHMPQTGTEIEVNHPCRSNPCKEDEVCEIRRKNCRHSATCPHYICKKGCKMGQVSKVLVPHGSNVLIPVYRNGEIDEMCTDFKVCHCGSEGSLGHCQDITCVANTHCRIEHTMKTHEHGAYYTQGCNDCVCFAGKDVCSRRQCSASTSENKFTGIQNCNCVHEFRPVCAANGRTYPSACIAVCAGQTVFIDGACSQHSPCTPNPCQQGYKCVANRQVCFGHKNSPCPQYQCVSQECNPHQHEPVCDSTGKEFTNVCIMMSKGRTEGYKGHCVTQPCASSESVCGQDGETYSSECAALAARTAVDYKGPCAALPDHFQLPGEVSRLSLCEGVECRPVAVPGCQGIIPPGACCPICAAELRVLPSESLAYIPIQVRKGPLTMRNILRELSALVTVTECDVFGYLGLNGDIVVLLTTVVERPTPLQVTACIKEAERLEYLIQSRSATITSNMILNPLLYAKLRTPSLVVTSGVPPFYTQNLLAVVILAVLHFSRLFFSHRPFEIV
ncbi:reversion-inducing cysteine-rich protein with Kazal motifs-like [Mya arenaria]|uniref:reversion-inducing cysteine-rich protein with Kazal motifs-like n=1 Tax=Mya arenaria TaxID=6604 RepID=UPI0022DEB7D6|nr:reversion-inducing cysteine-rich protein with Kazal motifs-like [Mya arenaria]